MTLLTSYAFVKMFKTMTLVKNDDNKEYEKANSVGKIKMHY